MYVSMYVKKNLKLIFHIKIFFYRAFENNGNKIPEVEGTNYDHFPNLHTYT